MICRVTGKTVVSDGGPAVCREHGGTNCLVCSICFVQALNDVDVKPVENNPIHRYFGLSYSSYLVVPRSLLQSMPDAWQTRFVRCLEELFDVYDNPSVYNVQARDTNGKFVSDNLADYARGSRYVVPGEEQDEGWKETAHRRFHEKFEADHGMTWSEHVRLHRERKQREEEAQYDV